jgi:hypothetical protein
MARDDTGPRSNSPGPRSNDPGPIETGPVAKRSGSSSFNIGNVQGTGIVIGDLSSASVKPHQPSAQRDAALLLDEFIQLLASYEDSVADAAGIRESATVARAELAKRSPRWQVVRGLLRGIAAGVAHVSVLAEAINNVQALVAISVDDQNRQ